MTDKDNTTTQAEAFARRLEEAKDAAWQQFLAQPMTRLAISLVPAGDDKDVLPLVLRAAFTAGFNSGQASFGIEMLTKIIMDRKHGEPR